MALCNYILVVICVAFHNLTANNKHRLEEVRRPKTNYDLAHRVVFATTNDPPVYTVPTQTVMQLHQVRIITN